MKKKTQTKTSKNTRTLFNFSPNRAILKNCTLLRQQKYMIPKWKKDEHRTNSSPTSSYSKLFLVSIL